MKKILILLALTLLTGCVIKYKPINKPYIIVSKSTVWSNGDREFTYQDKAGSFHNFYDKEGAYKIGDTIK